MANVIFDVERGGTYDITQTDRVFTLNRNNRKMSLENQGANIVYLRWDQDTAEANDTEQSGKYILLPGKAVHCPEGIVKFAAKCATSLTSKLACVEY